MPYFSFSSPDGGAGPPHGRWGSSMAVGSSRTMHRGTHGDDAGNGHPLLLSARELVGRVLPEFIHAHQPGAHRPPAGGSPPADTPIFSGAKATSSSTMVATSWLSGFWNTMPTVCRMSKSLSSSVVFDAVHIAGRRRWAAALALKCLARVDSCPNHCDPALPRTPLPEWRWRDPPAPG